MEKIKLQKKPKKAFDKKKTPFEKPKFEESDLGTNIFISYLQIPVSHFPAKNEYVKDDEGILVNKEVDVEYTPYTKVYQKSNLRLIIAGLTDKSKSLYLWITYELDSNKDYLWINVPRYMEENKLSSLTTYYNAIKELQRWNIMVNTTVKGVYWINPEYFFRGNRIEKYPNNLVKR
jgi:hypothetical protein